MRLRTDNCLLKFVIPILIFGCSSRETGTSLSIENNEDVLVNVNIDFYSNDSLESILVKIDSIEYPKIQSDSAFELTLNSGTHHVVISSLRGEVLDTLFLLEQESKEIGVYIDYGQKYRFRDQYLTKVIENNQVELDLMTLKEKEESLKEMREDVDKTIVDEQLIEFVIIDHSKHIIE